VCNNYGLPPEFGERFPFEEAGPTLPPPLNEQEPYTRLLGWVEEFKGSARITGVNRRNYNPVIRTPDEADGNVAPALDFGWWSLWIHGRLPKGYDTWNARDDKLANGNWWKEPFRQRRGLLPATWYVERGKRFGLGGELFTLGALWSPADVDGNGDQMLTYTMTTRASVGQASTVHPRMPLIIAPQLRADWLDPKTVGDEELKNAVVAASEELSRAASIFPDAEPGEAAVQAAAKKTQEPTLF